MPGRLPTAEDFPPNITASIVPAPSNHPPTNILVLLHGLGDTNASFTSLGRQLNLPETACISLQAPKPLPFGLGGSLWGDEIIFDEKTGEIDLDSGCRDSTRMVLDHIIRNILIEKCGYKPRNIMLFGLGQGGMVGLNVAVEMGMEELAGVVSIGGPLPSHAALAPIDKKFKTPVILCKGNKDSKVSPADVQRIKDTFAATEIQEWKKTGDGMPTNREEMLPIMQLFARRLLSMRGIPEGSVEFS
ncbi:alpha/beta-hydrolase [Aulographum hederae CBS 113979]|uniref:Alpha/beta-hydrolase n=1 Tax=Aulographum hederae CBS 113979 TaxID=1176131 RepID=A0A6G1H015_9PEZI|nr:alpha/beta-hydrolase [Aulographum hederae CBS 113979]